MAGIEIQLSMHQEPLTKDEICTRIKADKMAPGYPLDPDQISIVNYEDARTRSRGTVLALTWRHCDKLAAQLEQKEQEGDPLTRRLACRVEPQALVQFASQILYEFAPQMLAK